MTTATETRAAAIEKLRDLTWDMHVAMLTTTMPDGTLRSRPMVAQMEDFDGDFWFFTAWESEKVHEILQDAHVNLTFAKPVENRYVSVSGRATIVRDRAKAAGLWNSAYAAWFPQGLADPNLALLRVRAEQAEYWDAATGSMIHIAGFTAPAEP